MLVWKFHILPSHPVGRGLWPQLPQASENCKKPVSYCKGPKRISSFCGKASRRLFLPRGWGKLRGFRRAVPAHSCWAWMEQSKRSWGKDVQQCTGVAGGVQQAEQKSNAEKKPRADAMCKKNISVTRTYRQLSLLGLGLRVFLCTSLTGIPTALNEISALSLMENIFVSMSGL